MAKDSSIEYILGQEFLTWLWYRSEALNGTFHTRKENSPYVMYIHQKVVVRGGESDAVETASVSGIHSSFREAKMGLKTGKLVSSALVSLEKEENTWHVSLRAEDFSLNGLATEKIDTSDTDDEPDALFFEKMYLIEQAIDLLDDVYAQFISTRLDDKAWLEECERIAEWILAAE